MVSASLLLAACGGGGGGSTPPVSPAAPATMTPAPVVTATPNAQAFICPTSGTAGTGSAIRLGSSGRSSDATTRHPFKGHAQIAAATNTLLAVSYTRSAAAANVRQIAGREQALGANLVHTYDFPARNIAMRVLSVPTAQLAQTESQLRAQPGVQSIGVTGERRYHATSSAVYTNDPYFQGFAPNTEVLPFAESANVPGQWDMHAIGLEHAFGYSQPNTTPATYSNALGSNTIGIAIIDTGADASHPELTHKIHYQKCFITNEAGVQSTGSFSTDEDGHGTDVSGIAAAASGNGLGFAGAGGNALIYAYRVFPTPDDSCANSASTDAVCSSNTQDIADAINDAVNVQHVNVISLSLGGGGCTAGGVDSDAAEGAAISDAIAKKVIVVAASGNNGPTPVGLTAPGCVTGVIAVGATSLDDGTPTGTTGNYTTAQVSSASATTPVEYVASYSQYGGSATLHDQYAWGIVAPGGDPAPAESTASGTVDNLHWIENIWTSTPFGGQGDPSFAGTCSPDLNSSGPNDCRTLIAGTSMSTPHVAGAAALILAVNPSYQSPNAMKKLLCQTADDLGDSHQGCGRLNVYRAMATALNDPNPP